jgi:hypothetical protein
MGHALRFGADLPDKIGRREVGQYQSGDEEGTDDGLGAIQGQIPGGSNEGQQRGNDSLDRKLQQLNRPDAGCADTQGDKLGPDRNPAITEQGVAKCHGVHAIATCILLGKEQGGGFVYP